MESPFVPVRILNKKWAGKFIRGEIFMRSLSEFGSWNRFKNLGNNELINHFRGDLDEGAIKTVANAEDDEFFQLLPNDFKEALHVGKIIDAGNIPYFNVLCAYCLHYLFDKQTYETPSEHLREFGDTAVIITDMNEFLSRLTERIERRVQYAFLMDTVTYYSEETTKQLNPLFNKNDRYAWQNELRLAVGRLSTGKRMKNGKYPIVKSSDPLKLRLLSLSDIVIQVSVEDFLRGQWDKSRVKLVDLSDKKTFAGVAKLKTDEIMREYVPKELTCTFTI